IGAGPGSPDLLTIRGAKLIGGADVVVWARSLVHEGVLEYASPAAEVVGPQGGGDGVLGARSLVHEGVLEYASPEAEIVESTTIPLEGVRELYERAVGEDLKVARVHSGDPSLYGAGVEQIEQ